MTTQPLTAAERERLRKAHQPLYGRPALGCLSRCDNGEHWPCPTIRLLEELEAAERREDALVVGWRRGTAQEILNAMQAIEAASDARKVSSP